MCGDVSNLNCNLYSTDLISLLEDTGNVCFLPRFIRSLISTCSLVEGSWVGARARAVYGNADIGSAYSPPNKGVTSPSSDDNRPPRIETTVETVLDIGFREEVGIRYGFVRSIIALLMVAFQGWLLKCEKGGIRRVLMNLLGNSLKVLGLINLSDLA